MPERNPPPPASDQGLGLDELIGGEPPKPNPAKKSTRARTSFEATKVVETTRVKTEHAELFDNRRTFAQGLAVPTKYQSQFQPNVAAGAKIKGLVKASKYKKENE